VPDLDQENVFVEMEEIELNDHMFNYLLQLGFSYHLTPEWSLNISPWYKHNLNSVFNNNYPVDQRFNTIGINFGLRVDL
jgi:outer membrane protein W